MKDEAAANAASDQQEKEKVDTINKADSMIFQTEKQLKEFGDKLPADKKAPIESALQELKEAHKAQDVARINSAIDKLNSVFQAASQEMYNRAVHSKVLRVTRMPVSRTMAEKTRKSPT